MKKLTRILLTSILATSILASNSITTNASCSGKMTTTVNGKEYKVYYDSDDDINYTVTYPDGTTKVFDHKPTIDEVRGNNSSTGVTLNQTVRTEQKKEVKAYRKKNCVDVVVNGKEWTSDIYRELNYLNKERKKKGLKPVVLDKQCQKAATQRAKESLFLTGHFLPDGISDCDYTLDRYITDGTSTEIWTAGMSIDDFKDSSRHWAVAMGEGWTRVGISQVSTDSPYGNLCHGDLVVVFATGTPSKLTVSKNAKDKKFTAKIPVATRFLKGRANIGNATFDIAIRPDGTIAVMHYPVKSSAGATYGGGDYGEWHEGYEDNIDKYDEGKYKGEYIHDGVKAIYMNVADNFKVSGKGIKVKRVGKKLKITNWKKIKKNKNLKITLSLKKCPSLKYHTTIKKAIKMHTDEIV